MDLDLVDYQDLMVATFRDFFGREVALDVLRTAEKDGFDPGIWARFVNIGGHTLSLPDGAGGGGGTLLDAVLVGIEAGRRLAPFPYGDVAAAFRLLARAYNGCLPPIVEPTDVAVAVLEHEAVSRNADGGLHGQLPMLRAGSVARYVVVPLDDTVQVIDLDGPGVCREPLANLGRFPLATVSVTGARPVATLDVHHARVDQLRSELRVLRAAELVGAGQRALELGVEYVKERRQFDRVIGSFQAVQHRLADRATDLDGAELLVNRAASYEQDAGRLRYYSAVALLQAQNAAELAAKESLQFFGGYGFMLECEIHMYLRFVKMLGILALDGHVTQDALPTRVGRLDSSGGAQD